MRAATLALALLAAACGQPASQTTVSGPIATTQAGDASPGSTSVGNLAAASFTLDRDALVGSWSFDRTCASDDGMSLEADGDAGLHVGNGTWAIAANNRIVLTLEGYELGVGPTGETLVYTITVLAPVTDDLIGDMAGPEIGQGALYARRCPPP